MGYAICTLEVQILEMFYFAKNNVQPNIKSNLHYRVYIITFGIYNFLGKLTVLRTVAEIDPQYIQNFLGIIQSEKL